MKQLLREKDTVIAATVMEFLRPSFVKLCKYAGFDLVYLEYEHALMNPAAFNDFVVSARDNGLPVVAKTPDLIRHLLGKILESGVAGIQLPRTNTAADIAKLVDFCKYPPTGTRAGVSGMASTDYLHVPAEEHLRRLNDELCIVAHIETREGLKNIDEIVSNPHVDICYVGTFDLAIDLGTPGDMNSPVVLEAMDRICEACLRYGVVPGANGSDPETIRALRAKGVRFFEGPSDLDMIDRYGRDFMASLADPNGAKRQVGSQVADA
ncbi:MAG: HpcH/HpaI aldolase family protein [Bryobacteraceae bacterium]